MKKRTIILAALALVLASTAGIGSAHAYFTTYAQAQGGYTLELGDRTEVHEEFGSWTKRVTVTSEEDSQPVYVRAKAFGPAGYTLGYSGEGWSVEADADGWYYYNGIVSGGESTSPLDVTIGGIPLPEVSEKGDNFNVVVVYESTPVRYDEDGNVIPNGSGYTGWSEEYILDSGQTEGGGN